MKRKTGELAWVIIKNCDIPVNNGVDMTAQPFGDSSTCSLLLCEKLFDIHTSKITWKPVSIEEGELEPCE